MKKLGKVEGSHQHARAEISAWKVKLDAVLKSIDDGLDFLMGLKKGDSLDYRMKSKVSNGLVSKLDKGLYVNKAIRNGQKQLRPFNPTRGTQNQNKGIEIDPIKRNKNSNKDNYQAMCIVGQRNNVPSQKVSTAKGILFGNPPRGCFVSNGQEISSSPTVRSSSPYDLQTKDQTLILSSQSRSMGGKELSGGISKVGSAFECVLSLTHQLGLKGVTPQLLPR